MSDTQEQLVANLLQSPRSRANFLKGAAVAAASLGVAPSVAAASTLHGGGVGGGASESVQTIINIAATAEAAAVTALYHLHIQVNRGKLDVHGVAVPVPVLVSVVRAALREEQDHLSFLKGAGAKPLLLSFTFPADILTSAVAALRFLEVAETVFIGAYIAANREFAGAGMSDLAQYAMQIGGTECEHRVLVRAALGQLPPNDKSFETNLYTSVAGAAGELEKLGVLKPGIAYPGPGAVDYILAHSQDHKPHAGVNQRHP